jgi:predicted tellurium resistance membrane protein TerC
VIDILARWRELITRHPALVVAAVALLALVAVDLIAVLSLPDKPPKGQQPTGQNVVVISAAAFGVIGGIVGAFFGVKTATDAMTARKRAADAPHGGSPTGIDAE